MGHSTTLNLVDVPWPMSILKCNQRVDAMRSGEQMTVALKDADTKENLVLLLNALPDVEWEVCENGGCILLNIKKRSVS